MQQIEFSCKGCGTRYSVNVTLAGRVAECRHCGQKMVVPYKSPVIKLGEENAIGFADAAPPARSTPQPLEEKHLVDPEPDVEIEMEAMDDEPSAVVDDSQPDLSDFDIKDAAPEYHAPRRTRKTPLVPELFADLVLPVLLLVIGFGWAGTVVVQRILASQNATIGFILLALAASGLLLVVIPLTLRGIEGSAKSLEFDLSNAIRLQTAGLVAVPTAALTLGWFADGPRGLITWGLVGLALMGVLIVLMYRAGIGKAMMSLLLTALCYVFGSGLTVGGIALLCFVLFKTGFTLPWGAESKREVAVAPIAPVAPKVEAPAPTPTPIEKPAEVVEAPKVVEAPVVAKPLFVWDAPAVDPMPALAGGKWASDVHHLIDIKPPIMLAQASTCSPFLAVVDGVALHVYDLRTGKRTGFVKEQVPMLNSGAGVLSPDGSTLLVSFGSNNTAANSARVTRNRASGPARSNSATPNFAPVPTAPELTIWSMTEGRLTRHIPIDSGRLMPQILGFTKSNAIVLTALNQQTTGTVAQVWDTKTASLTREFDIAPTRVAGANVALSAGGTFLAVDHNARLAVFNTETGERIGDIERPHGVNSAVRAMSFSPDGSQLALIVSDANALQLVVIDTATGKVATDAPLAGGARPQLASDELLWVPRGGGMLIGNDWIDCASGKIVSTISPQSAGQSVGQPRLMLSDYHVLIEFLPVNSGTGIGSGQQRVIYKTVMLPKKDIDTALASRNSRAASADDAIAAAPTTGPSGAVAAVDTDAIEQDVKTGPTSAPIGAPADLVRDAVAHLSYGRNQDALTAALAVVNRFPKGVKPTSDEHAIALHVAAVSYMRLGDFQKARAPIEQAIGYGKSCRSLVINRAKLDLMNQGTLIRAGKELDRLLAVSVDEDTLNLLGLSIDKAMKNTATVGQAKSLTERYDTYNKKLEATRSGMRHWGAKWMSESEYTAAVNPPKLVEKRINTERKVKLAAAEVDRTRKILADAKRQAFFDQPKKNIDRDSRRGNQPMYLSRAEDAFNAAGKDLDAAKLDLESIKASFPTATWIENLEPTLPELQLTPRAK